MSKLITIYTDGSCLGNPGKGGYAAILIYKGVEKIVKGSIPHTTNNIAELTAAIKALEVVKKPMNIELYSDSQYLIKGMNQWIYSWKSVDFHNVKNKELWERLNELSQIHEIKWKWVKAHSDNELNNRCDKIAKEQARLQLQENEESKNG